MTKFWPKGVSFDEALKDITVDDDIKRILKQRKNKHPRDIYMSTDEYDEVTGQDMVNLAINHIEVGNTVVEEAYMTEIQLRRIVERTAKDEVGQLSDGDEIGRGKNQQVLQAGHGPWKGCLRRRRNRTTYIKENISRL